MRPIAMTLALALVACGGDAGSNSLGADDPPRFFAAARGAEGWVAVGGIEDESHRTVLIASEADGWRVQEFPDAGRLTGVAWADGRWVAVGVCLFCTDNERVFVSDDAVSWRETALTLSYLPVEVVHDGFSFKAAVRDAGYTSVMVSDDGEQWDRVATVQIYAPSLRLAGGELFIYDAESGGIATPQTTSSWDVVYLPLTPISAIVGDRDDRVWGYSSSDAFRAGLALRDGAWTVHERPQDPSIRAITATNTMLVSAAADGLYRTTGEVEDWMWERTEDSTGWASISADVDEVVAVGDGVAISRNGGASWELVVE